MKIRTRFALLQIIIISGFLASMTYVGIRFNQAYNLKRLELLGVESFTSMKSLETRTRLFTSRNEPLDILWNEWQENLDEFDRLYSSMLNSPHHAILGRQAVGASQSRLEVWDATKVLEIRSLIQSMNEVLDSEIGDIVGDKGINATLEIYTGSEGEESEIVQQLGRIQTRFGNLRESMVASISIPTERFIENLSGQVGRFSGTLYIVALSVAVAIQAAGAIIGLTFSRRFSRHIIQLEQNLAQVADGNFDVSLDIRTGDEFQNISRHFNILTQDLWSRLDSMKDMMRDIGSSTGEGTSMADLEDFMLELAIDNTGADAGLLMSVDEGMLVLNKAQGYFPPPLALPPMVASKREYVTEWFTSHRIAPGEGILGQILVSGEPRFVRDNTDGELPDNANTDSDLYVNSAIFIPLKISGVTLGILALALTGQDSVFTDLDYSYMQSYGEFIALTMDNMQKYLELVKSHQITREIEVAADIQKTLLPEKMPSLKGAEVAAFSDAAKGVSGDYYDVFELGGGITAIAVCDVAGKGVPASLLMIMIRTVLRTISAPGKRADVILKELNRAITGHLGAERFATIGLVIMDRENHSISYSNGAHYPLHILRGDSGRYRRFDTDGLPLGIDSKANFGHKKIRIRPRDCLVLFTDGLPEARNSSGEELGETRLLRFVARHADQTPGELARRVKDYLDDFTAGETQFDDQTFLVLKVS